MCSKAPFAWQTWPLPYASEALRSSIFFRSQRSVLRSRSKVRTSADISSSTSAALPAGTVTTTGAVASVEAPAASVTVAVKEYVPLAAYTCDAVKVVVPAATSGRTESPSPQVIKTVCVSPASGSLKLALTTTFAPVPLTLSERLDGAWLLDPTTRSTFELDLPLSRSTTVAVIVTGPAAAYACVCENDRVPAAGESVHEVPSPQLSVSVNVSDLP